MFDIKNILEDLEITVNASHMVDMCKIKLMIGSQGFEGPRQDMLQIRSDLTGLAVMLNT